MEIPLNIIWLVRGLRSTLLNEIEILDMKLKVEDSCINQRLGKVERPKMVTSLFCVVHVPIFIKMVIVFLKNMLYFYMGFIGFIFKNLHMRKRKRKTYEKVVGSNINHIVSR